MPNPNKLIHKTRIEEEELEIQSELYALGQLTHIRPPKKLDPESKIWTLSSEIYQLFVEHAAKMGKPTKLPADVFEDLRKEYSNTSITKAKRFLSIRSIRRLGKWWWQFPLRAPNEAMQTVHQKLIQEYNPVAEQLTNLRRPAAAELQEIMKEHNLHITNLLAVQLMEKAGFSRPTTLHMKAILGIVGEKVDGNMTWYWPNRDVQDWLFAKLASGPVPHRKLSIEAWEENSWPFELLKWARKACPDIKWRIINSVGYWEDINQRSHAPSDRIVEVDMLPEASEVNCIILDFSDELEPEHELAPEPGKEDVVTTRRISHTPGGAPVEVFE